MSLVAIIFIRKTQNIRKKKNRHDKENIFTSDRKKWAIESFAIFFFVVRSLQFKFTLNSVLELQEYK